MWTVLDARVGEGSPRGRSGRSPSVRADRDLAGDANPLVLSQTDLSSGLVDDRTARHRCSRSPVDNTGRPVGDPTGGQQGRPVADVAVELGCDWHTANDAVVLYGSALLNTDTDRVGVVHAVSLDETLMVRRGEDRSQEWSTQIVDARTGQLLEIAAGRDIVEPTRWFMDQPQRWRDRVGWAVMDMSGPYKSAFDTALPDAEQVVDRFHVIRLFGQRGRAPDL